MDKKKKKLVIPKCRCGASPFASEKFCKECGRRLGFGMREPGEIKMELRNMDIVDLPDITLKQAQFFASHFSTVAYTLDWVLGQSDTTPGKYIEDIGLKSRREDK